MSSEKPKKVHEPLSLSWDSSAPDLRSDNDLPKRRVEGPRSLDDYFEFLEAFENEERDFPPVVVFDTVFRL